VSQAEFQGIAQQIIMTLGETAPKPCEQITAIVEKCGIEFAQSLLQETQEVEAQGGMMLPDQSRRRTPGGVFFHLARHKMPPELAKVIFSSYYKPKPAKKKTVPKKGKEQPAFDWTTRAQVIEPLLDKKGELTTVKVTLIGRPGKIDTSHKDVVITTMTHTPKSAGFPKGVPQPPQQPTLYTVYVSSKQWQKVKEAVANPEDSLIIEGTCAYDEQISGVAVFAMNITSKQLEAKKRQGQKESTVSSVGAEGVSSAPTAKPAKSKKEFDPPQPSPLAVPGLPNAPADAMQKLTELYASASLFRQKIATIQSKPAGQQFGLEMTQKLLKNVEDEIAAIEKKYQG
jgi:hypothetical protein